ncbi:multidrug efflux SMR transporter (plasmid) [Thermus thermophilus]|uniref:Cation/cationic drug transporter n=1 Tax=Thermus thermophilus JL-18 TaxID=798128 RepID=H9ZUA4_THETH|nr:multidrug efflux SMR transporter [Thermus thermophilus]AFH39914.1 cation/cationic drug transporter [Thermus thermophilus JL-18]
MSGWGYLALALIFEVVGAVSLKASAGFTRFWPTVGVVVGYGLTFYLVALSLRDLPLSLAYAVWAGGGTALVALAGWLFYREALTGMAALGVALVVIGIALIRGFGGGEG